VDSGTYTPLRDVPQGVVSDFSQLPGDPNQLRWHPPPPASPDTDWLDGLSTLCGSGSADARSGAAVHMYSCCASMERALVRPPPLPFPIRVPLPYRGLSYPPGTTAPAPRRLQAPPRAGPLAHRRVAGGAARQINSDGDLLLVPQAGALVLQTELGRLALAPGEIAVVPRGIAFRVRLVKPEAQTSQTAEARGYVLEVFRGHFSLPALGAIGANGLAAPRDFLYPCAAFEVPHPPSLPY
jgi:homogentisate 1,2-dioxygenase